MLCELEAVVQGDGFWLKRHDGVSQPAGDVLGIFAIGIIHDDQESRFAFDGGDEVVFLFFEVHEIGLPVVIVFSVVDVVVTGVDRYSALYFTT